MSRTHGNLSVGEEHVLMAGIIEVLLADDHEALRELLRALIDTEPDLVVVGVAADGRAAVDVSRLLRPTVVVMDLSMPVLNGLAATARLTRSAQRSV